MSKKSVQDTKQQIDQLWKQFRVAINAAYADTNAGDPQCLREYAENISCSDSLATLLEAESANERQHRSNRSITGFSVETAAKLILLHNVVAGAALLDMPSATDFLIYRKTAVEARVLGFLVGSFLSGEFYISVNSMDYVKLMERGSK